MNKIFTKRIFVMWLLMVVTAQITNAQTNIATGNVKDDKGNPLHFVFVRDKQSTNAVYTDSLGNFKITINPGSTLQFAREDYAGTELNITNTANLQVVLKSTATAESGNSANTLGSQIEVKSSNVPEATIGTGGVITPSHQKGELRGSKYLFTAFVHGFVINSSDVLNYNPGYLYDYDKLGGSLLLTQDNKSISEASYDEIKSFVLYSNTDERMVFEKDTKIDPSHYMQVLASGKKYKIYKFITTKFVRADYVNSGVLAHGTDFDEFVDDADYYVVDGQGNDPKKLSLKKKSIKEDFSKDADKVNKFLTDNSGRINDTYLSKLGDYMNQ
jgi:hypothetical protein